MMLNRKIILLFLLYLSCISCSCRRTFSERNPELDVKRFDTGLCKYLNKQVTEEAFTVQYKSFLDVFGMSVIGVGSSDSIGFYERLNTFFLEPTLMSLYKREQELFPDFEFVDRELNPALTMLLKEFPGLKSPSVYVHVSGLNQNVIVTDEVLSLSADKYLGIDYPLYKDFFYDYQRQNMTPERIVPDYLLGFMMANFPFEGNQEVLLERMLYEGKLRYILSLLLPERDPQEYVAYTKAQYSWCNDHQSEIWKIILKSDHLYVSDYMIVTQYMNDAPYTVAISPKSPGRIGEWVGYQIISAFMKNRPKTTLIDLMKLTDAGQLLKDSKYKP
ncbi:MAG: hypothetical protein LBJ72_01810 [Dysgonamonadaceae bacterium]|jgi:hypothetical protein|nr:hypothetical protein [Dysgonamonadaceae bacterium]